MGIDRASIHRIGRQTIRGENTPYGDVATGSNRIQRTGSGSAWAYNATGYELYDGYIVAVTGYDPVTNSYTIARPTADSMPNIAVVASSYCANSSTARVEITFSGDVFLRYSGTAPTVADTVGSGSSSFEAKIGAVGFAPLETGADGRCRARFFSGGEQTQLLSSDNVGASFQTMAEEATPGYYYYESSFVDLSDPIDFNPSEWYASAKSSSANITLSVFAYDSSYYVDRMSCIVRFYDDGDNEVALGIIFYGTDSSGGRPVDITFSPSDEFCFLIESGSGGTATQMKAFVYCISDNTPTTSFSITFNNYSVIKIKGL